MKNREKLSVEWTWGIEKGLVGRLKNYTIWQNQSTDRKNIGMDKIMKEKNIYRRINIKKGKKWVIWQGKFYSIPKLIKKINK